MGSESGQATVEWTAAVVLVAVVLGGALALAPAVDGRSFGGFLAHRVACAATAVTGGCRDGDAALARAYGDRDAALLRRHAPGLVYEPGERQLPVDYRRCRRPACANAPDDPDADVHRTNAGERATVFTRLLRRDRRVYLQYHLYYPDSNTAWAGSDKAWERSWVLPRVAEALTGSGDYPGWHRDDWESVQLRIDPDGRVWARASSHAHYQGCKQAACRNQWIEGTGWSRVSRGSHAGHIPVEGDRPQLPGRDLRERTTTPEGLRLIPLETLDHGAYEQLDEDVLPPWRKPVYHHPERDDS